MLGQLNLTRLRRGVYLIAIGTIVTLAGLSIGPEFFQGVRLTLYGPLIGLAGVGYVGAAAVPVFVTAIGGQEATWDDLSLLWQMAISFVVAIGLFVLYLIVFWLLP